MLKKISNLEHLQELKMVLIHGANHVLEKEVKSGTNRILKLVRKKVVNEFKKEEIGLIKLNKLLNVQSVEKIIYHV